MLLVWPHYRDLTTYFRWCKKPWTKPKKVAPALWLHTDCPPSKMPTVSCVSITDRWMRWAHMQICWLRRGSIIDYIKYNRGSSSHNCCWFVCFSPVVWMRSNFVLYLLGFILFYARPWNGEFGYFIQPCHKAFPTFTLENVLGLNFCPI